LGLCFWGFSPASNGASKKKTTTRKGEEIHLESNREGKVLVAQTQRHQQSSKPTHPCAESEEIDNLTTKDKCQQNKEKAITSIVNQLQMGDAAGKKKKASMGGEQQRSLWCAAQKRNW